MARPGHQNDIDGPDAAHVELVVERKPNQSGEVNLLPRNISLVPPFSQRCEMSEATIAQLR